MRKLLFALFATMLAMPLTAQIEMDKFFWNQGPLTLDMFEKRHTGADDKVFSFLEWQLSTTDTTIKVGNTRFISEKVDLYMFKSLSWYDPDRTPDWSLRYNQAEFDLAEVLRRQYQNSLNSDSAGWVDRSYFNKLLKVKVETYEAETGYGADTTAIVRYEDQLREQLNSVVEYPFRNTEYRLKPAVQIGMNVTYDFEYFFKPLSNAYGPAHGVQGMLFLYSGRFFFNTSYTWSWSGGLKTDSFYQDPDSVLNNYEWQKGKGCRSEKFMLNFGYDVIDRKYFTIAPVIGIGTTDLKQNTGIRIDGGPDQFSLIDGARVSSGLSIGYKYKRTCSKWYTEEHMVKLNLLAAYSGFGQSLPNNWSINAGITFETKRWTKR